MEPNVVCLVDDSAVPTDAQVAAKVGFAFVVERMGRLALPEIVEWYVVGPVEDCARPAMRPDDEVRGMCAIRSGRIVVQLEVEEDLVQIIETAAHEAIHARQHALARARDLDTAALVTYWESEASEFVVAHGDELHALGEAVFGIPAGKWAVHEAHAWLATLYPDKAMLDSGQS